MTPDATPEANERVIVTLTGVSGDGFINPAASAATGKIVNDDRIATFDFRLVDATVTYQGESVIIDSRRGHSELSGIDRYVFTDGTVDENDGNALVDDLFYYSRNRCVERACRCRCALQHLRLSRGPRSERVLLAADLSVGQSRREGGGVNPLTHFHQIGWIEGREPVADLRPAEIPRGQPDVAAAHVDPLEHFLQFGVREGASVRTRPSVTANSFDLVYLSVAQSGRGGRAASIPS